MKLTSAMDEENKTHHDPCYRKNPHLQNNVRLWRLKSPNHHPPSPATITRNLGQQAPLQIVGIHTRNKIVVLIPRGGKIPRQFLALPHWIKLYGQLTFQCAGGGGQKIIHKHGVRHRSTLALPSLLWRTTRHLKAYRQETVSPWRSTRRTETVPAMTDWDGQLKWGGGQATAREEGLPSSRDDHSLPIEGKPFRKQTKQMPRSHN